MAVSLFFEKKEIFERGVDEVRVALRGRDVTTIPQAECGALAKKYKVLATLAGELCTLARTSSSKEQYTAYATRLSERANTLALLAKGKSTKATPDEKRRELLEEFNKRTEDIKKRLRSREPKQLTAEECETLSKKYEKLALVAGAIAKIARTEEDEQRYSEFYERLMCRVAELSALARKKGKKKGAGEEKTPASVQKKSQKKPPEDTVPEADTTPTREEEHTQGMSEEERRLALMREAEAIFLAYENLIRGYASLEEGTLSEEERAEYAYFIRYYTESAEFFEAVRKKEIKTLSPEEILSLQTK